MSSIRSLRLCCHSSNRLRTPGSICKRPKESTIKSTRNGCHWRRSVTARTNYRWQQPRDGPKRCSVFYMFPIFRRAERKGGGETEMGVPATWQATQRHHPRVSGRFCAKHNGQTTVDMRTLESRSKRENATHRLFATGRQSLAPRLGNGHSVQGDPVGKYRRRTIGKKSRLLATGTVRQSVSH